MTTDVASHNASITGHMGGVQLVLGGGGSLGRRIVDVLLAQPGQKIRVGLRKGHDSDLASRWKALGAEIVHADLFDSASLLSACQGVTTVVSAVQGGLETIVQGQTRLLEACVAENVHRFIPSDFSINRSAIRSGINQYCDMKNHFARIADASVVNCTHILTGGFTDVIFSRPGLIDVKAGTITYWGSGDIALDLTCLSDVAAFVGAIINDSRTLNTTVSVAGDRRTVREIACDWESATGQKLKHICRGSIEEGYARFAELLSEGKPSIEMLILSFILPMMSGAASLIKLDNERFRQVHPTSLLEFFRANFAGAANKTDFIA